MGPCSSKAGQGVFHPRQGNLKRGFFGMSSFGKDIDNDLLSVDDADFRFTLPVALLGGGELFVEDNNVDVFLVYEIYDFLEFAFADQEGGRWLSQVHDHPLCDGNVEIARELGEFLQKVFGFLARHPRLLNANEEGVLNFLSVFFEVEHGRSETG